MKPETPGCGKPTHVAGTNGGMMPCGAVLTQLDGTKAPYYCGRCDPGPEKWQHMYSEKPDAPHDSSDWVEHDPR
jgi:hypothetical protein